ncbi:P-loop containing nucleoside triphosphate hydrolase protein [Penicillium sp. IBT 16267x]|nr:P-loop containing nucleoside triphosphate hydrolase protein [Penicillium sp. IBT 16267x]
MKSIEMMGYSREIEEKIKAARDKELIAGLATYWLNVLLAGCANFLNVVGPAITLGVYTIVAKLTGGPLLDTDRVFTSFALIQMVTLPANSILFIVPDFIAAIAGFDRIQNFLLEPTHEDSRVDLAPRTPVDPVYEGLLSQTPAGRSIYSEDGCSIKIQTMSVRYHTEGRPALKDINIEIEAGWLVIVTGVTGSGKTTLARTIIGDLQAESGLISTSSRQIAFCNQSPWLPNGTIRDLIAEPPGSKVTDEKWYQRVLHACDLQYDLSNLPNSDRTFLESGGSSLSGGQRQRVALAHAIYSRLDILALDDIFSALDVRTARRVARRLMGPSGLFRELKKTVLLITHSTQFLPHSDLIVTLVVDGSISERSTWDQIKPQIWSFHKQIDEDLPVKDPSDDISHYINAIGKSRIMATLFIMISSASFTMVIQNWLRWWTADEKADQRTWFYLAMYLLLALGHWLSLTGIAIVSLLIVPTSGRNLHSQLLRTVLNGPLSFITSTDIATTLSRVSQDMKQIDRRLPAQVAALGSQAFKLLAQILLLFMAQTYMLFIFPVLLVVVYAIQTAGDVLVHQPAAEMAKHGGQLASKQQFSGNRSRNAIDTSQVPSYTLLAIEQWLALVLDLVVAAVALLNVILIVIVIRSETISAGEVGISMSVILMVSIVLLVTVQSWANFDASPGVISRIRNFSMTVLPESPEETLLLPDLCPTNGAVEFDDVIADYAAQSNSDSTSTAVHALNKISLNLVPGRKIGVYGRTGNGKSSLLLSILRLIDLSEGCIKIDNLDITSVFRDTLRSRIITIPQDPFVLASDSIRDNLDIQNTNSSEEILTALEKVHLRPLLDARAGYGL